jgi:hypothetical protein
MHFAVCDFALDLIQNSVEAGSRTIELGIVEDDGWITAVVLDDGKGMSTGEMLRARDPFYTDGSKHARRKVGLGIPFLVQAVEQAGGDWSMDSKKGEGTRIFFRFPKDGVDTPPMGDLTGLFLSGMCFEGDYEFVAKHRAPALGIDYELRRSKIIEAVGNLASADALVSVRQFLASYEAI